MSKWQTVSEEQFATWRARYPGKIQPSVSPHGWFTAINYYDFSRSADLNEARVAHVEFGEAPGEPNGEKPVKWSIRTESMEA